MANILQVVESTEVAFKGETVEQTTFGEGFGEDIFPYRLTVRLY